MKKLAVAIVGVLLAAPALPAQHRVFSRPALPTQEDLDRLNLKMSWYTYLPVDGKRDGIFSVRVDTSQVLVLLRSAVVLALDPQTGATLWRARVGLPYVPPVGFGANSRSVFVAKGVNIYALDRTNGNPQWEFALPNAPAAAPVADEEHIFVALGTNRLNAYTLPVPGKAVARAAPVVEKKPEEPMRKSLESIYQNKRTASILGVTGSFLSSVSAVSSGGQTVRSIGAFASALPARSVEGTGLHHEYCWDYVTETRPETRLEQASILTTDYVFEAGANGLFFTVSKYEPRIVYKFQADAPVSAGIGSHGDIAYVPSEDYRVYALDIVTAKILWRFLGGGPIRQQPRVTDDSVYVAAERAGLYRLDRATGNLLWQNREAERFLAANPKFVYAVDPDGKLLVLDRARGSRLATYSGTHDYTVTLPNELTDRVFLSSNDGLLICLHDRDYPRPLRNKIVEEKKPAGPAPADGKKPAPDKAPVKPTDKPKPKDMDKDEDK